MNPRQDPYAASPRLLSVATAVPPHVARQPEVKALMSKHFAEAIAADPRLPGVFDNAGIDQRNLCVPLEWLASDHDFEERNRLYFEHALELAAEAATCAMSRARVEPAGIDHVVFVSSTGLSTPSLDAHLANRFGFRADVRRTPLWGLGCAGGAVGIARARDLALASPASTVLVIAVELCSLTFQASDVTKKNLVATSIFADGAAAAVVAGRDAPAVEPSGHRRLELLASRSMLWPGTIDVMGWTVGNTGLHVVFSRDIPDLIATKVAPSLADFLCACGVTPDAPAHLAMHPGGAKVLHAFEHALRLPREAFRHAHAILREHGNMSSPTCLFVLERFLEGQEIAPGEPAVLAGMGPGFSAEYVLLRGMAS